MDNNVKIVLGNGDVLDAVGISYIHIEASNKDYVFYSLNELANGNMDKIYIAEASQNGVTPGTISDDEWNNIKQIMLNISHNEAVTGISYKPIVGKTINVGEAKKLAIKGDKKQAFIDAQNKAVAPNAEIDEPAFVSDQAANGSPFFASDVSATGPKEKVVPETKVESAFNMQPPVQQEVTTESLELNPAAQIQPVATPNNMVVEQPAPVEENTTVQQIESPAVEEPAIIDTQVVPEVQKVEDIPMPVVENVSDSTDINVGELKQAVVDAQNAIDKINKYLSSLNKETSNPVKKVVVGTVQTQTIATGVSPVSTESMAVANQPEVKVDELAEESTLVNPNDIITPTEMVIPVDPAQAESASPAIAQVIQPVETINTQVAQTEVLDTTVPAQSNIIDTTVPTQGDVIDTSVQSGLDVSIVPLEQESNVEQNVANEEPAFSIDDSLEQTQTLDLNNVVVPQSTPNSAADINNSNVVVDVPAAPVTEVAAPVIPIPPSEVSGIPTAQIIPTVEAAPAAPAAPVQQDVIQPITDVINPQIPSVEGVPEINVEPVQQVPTLDISAINTNVTLPTDMTSNPNNQTVGQGMLGPATLDVNSETA